MNIWIAGTTNQLFIRGSYIENYFLKSQLFTGKIRHSICLTIAFRQVIKKVLKFFEKKSFFFIVVFCLFFKKLEY